MGRDYMQETYATLLIEKNGKCRVTRYTIDRWYSPKAWVIVLLEKEKVESFLKYSECIWQVPLNNQVRNSVSVIGRGPESML